MTVQGNIRFGILTVEVGVDGFAVVTHVGIVQIGERANDRFLPRQPVGAELEFKILRAGAPQRVIERNAIGER